MPARQKFLLYYITDRTAFPGDEEAKRQQLLAKIAEAARQGVDYIQLREKDLSIRALEGFAREAIRIVLKQRTENPELKTSLLINSRVDVALATAAAGVHLRGKDLSPEEVRSAWRSAIRDQGTSSAEISRSGPVIAISCHSSNEVTRAAAARASFAVLAPIFEKQKAPGANPIGLEALRHACRAEIPVVALGGVTLQNAQSCLQAGAAGIAAIRLFQENDIPGIVKQLRG